MTPEEILDAAISADTAPAARLRSVGPDDDAPPVRAVKLSEIDLADSWVSRFGNSWRYVREWDRWFEWRQGDSAGWFEDTTGAVRASAVSLLREVESWPDIQSLTASQRRKLASSGSVAAVVGLAGVHRAVATSAAQWDAHTMLLGVPGGTVDLESGEFFTPDPLEYITKRCSVAPEEGEPVLWLRHLELVLQGDRELIDYLQRWCGYCLTGEVGEHAMLMGIGTGANGKSVIFDTLTAIFGDYAYAAPVNLLMESRTERHPTEIAILQGKRLVLCSEPPQGARWDDGRLKALTGDAKLTARRMNQDLSTFAVTHKLNVMGNHMPVLRSVDEAIRRRVNLLQFRHTIPAAERDPNFMDKLRAEHGQILQWCIDGCREWRRTGLQRPDSMAANTAEYLADEDTMQQFIEECCDREPTAFDTLAVLFRAYGAWCERVGEKAVGRKAFKAALRDTPGVTRNRVAGDAVQGLAVKEAHRATTHDAPSRWSED